MPLGLPLRTRNSMVGAGGRPRAGTWRAPVFGCDAVGGKEVDVGGGVHGHHVGVQPVATARAWSAGPSMDWSTFHVAPVVFL